MKMMHSRLLYSLIASLCLVSSCCLAANLQLINQEERPIQTNDKISENGNQSRIGPQTSSSGENSTTRIANFGDNFPSFGNIVLDSRILDGLGGLLTIDESEDDGQFNYKNKDKQHQHQMGRESRRFAPVRSNLGSLWSKPKVSPLYLINGTVCRFVNSNPICTTLSTRGLLPAASSTPRSAAVSSGNNGASGSSVVFASQNQAPPMRPAAIVDEDSAIVNVEEVNQSGETVVSQQQRNQQLMLQTQQQSSSGSGTVVNKPQQYSTGSLSQQQAQQQQQKQQQANAPIRPVNLIGRRTLNLLSLRRPTRQQPQQ